jgi:hypothetical protein
MPSGFVVARRAHRIVRKDHAATDGGRAVVVKASRPTIQGNCASADVYSFGIIAWECVTRSDPYGQMPPFQVIFAVGTQGARPAIPADCPPEMTNLITSAWAEEPADRPTFTEIAQRISRDSADSVQWRAAAANSPQPAEQVALVDHQQRR